MAEFNNCQDLKEFVSTFKTVTESKNYIEDKTAYLITNSKYYENLRHAFSHLVSALDLQLQGDAEVEHIHNLYVDATNHIDNLDVNGYEFLAGFLNNEIVKKIENAGLFESCGNADLLRQEALRHLDKGRNSRPSNKVEAMRHFEKCIDLCLAAKKEFKPISKIEKIVFRVNYLTMIFSGLAVVAALISVFLVVFKK